MKRVASKILYGSAAFLAVIAATASTNAWAQDTIAKDEAGETIVVSGTRIQSAHLMGGLKLGDRGGIVSYKFCRETGHKLDGER